MLRMTVTWCKSAEADVAEMYLQSTNRLQLRSAVHEADSLLKIDGQNKGEPWYAGQLPFETVELLRKRKGEIPEVTRVMQIGPIEVYFECSIPDRLVVVWHVRSRR